jgi:hypothetical protein
MWDDDRIDAAIDETARQMTAGEPRTDFRVRVVERIGGRPRTTAMWRPAVAALSVAALFIIGFIVMREHPQPRTSAPPPVRLVLDTAAKPVDVGPKANAGAGFEVAQGFSPAIAALKGCATGNCEPVSGRDFSHDVDALNVPPLELDSIAVAALPPDDSMHIEPLPPAAPIAVTPLGVENEGDRR